MTARLWTLTGVLILALLVVIGTRKEARSENEETVSAAIVLAIDYSGSISTDEMAWQIGGLAEVFADPEIERRIAESSHEAIAICAFRFAASPQEPFIPWTILRPGDGSVARFSLLLQQELALVRENRRGLVPAGVTNTGLAISFGHRLLMEWPNARRFVIDIQTDEKADDPEVALAARAAAGVDGVLINVLMIGVTGRLNETMAHHYLTTATGMVWDARDAAGYRAAIEAKLFSEIW